MKHVSLVDPIPREHLPEFEQYFASVEKSFGYLPNSQLITAHWPELLQPFGALMRTLWEHGEAPHATKVMVAIVVSLSAGSRYGQAHGATMASEVVDPEKIKALWDFESSELFSEAERAALRLARNAGRVPNQVDAANISEMRTHYSPRAIVEIVAVISWASATGGTTRWRWNWKRSRGGSPSTTSDRWGGRLAVTGQLMTHRAWPTPDIAASAPTTGAPMSSTHIDLPLLADPHVEEVSEGVYAYIQPDGSWFINNAGFVVGPRAITSIDACSTERRTRAYLDAIRMVSSRPVKTLVNTHHHGDHTHGNYLFTDATIVGHERCRKEIIAAGLPDYGGVLEEVDWGALELAPPFLTFTESVTLWAGDLACEVRHVGRPAHTTNDAVVWLPERSVLFCGDLLFNQGTPFLLMGSVAGAIDVLEGFVKPLGARTIIPGHGPVAGRELIDSVLGYLHFVMATAQAGVAAGVSPLQAAADTDLGAFAELSDSERIVGNLHRAYAELNGTPPGGGIDVAAALRDMVTFNGGRPLTCRA